MLTSVEASCCCLVTIGFSGTAFFFILLMIELTLCLSFAVTSGFIESVSSIVLANGLLCVDKSVVAAALCLAKLLLFTGALGWGLRIDTDAVDEDCCCVLMVGVLDSSLFPTDVRNITGVGVVVVLLDGVVSESTGLFV